MPTVVRRRRFLSIVMTPAILAASDRLSAADRSGARLQERTDPTTDPEVQRLRALVIDESVEPALVFYPGNGLDRGAA